VRATINIIIIKEGEERERERPQKRSLIIPKQEKMPADYSTKN
jgi:hypothetical protein